MSASTHNGVYVNLIDDYCIDMDKEFRIADIREIIYDSEDRNFYLLSNKHKGKIGIYVAKIFESDPYKNSFLIRWKTLLEIGDCNIFVMRNEQMNYKELIISYCSIYVNTHNVIVMDINKNAAKGQMIFRHESYQLWEQKITGMLLSNSKDFVSVSSKGI